MIKHIQSIILYTTCIFGRYYSVCSQYCYPTTVTICCGLVSIFLHTKETLHRKKYVYIIPKCIVQDVQNVNINWSSHILSLVIWFYLFSWSILIQLT